MSTATDVLTAVSGVMTAIYPLIPVRVRKGSPGPAPESPLAGWTSADPNPCLIVSCQDPEPVDSAASFEHVSVGYVVSIAYVKPNLARTGVQEDDPDVRDKRVEIREALFKPSLTGVGLIFDIRFKSEDPYSGSAGGSPVVSVSKEVMTFTATEPRSFN